MTDARPDPSCHACGGPVAVGEPIALYHQACDPGARVQALERDNAVLKLALAEEGGYLRAANAKAQELEREVAAKQVEQDFQRKRADDRVQAYERLGAEKERLECQLLDANERVQELEREVARLQGVIADQGQEADARFDRLLASSAADGDRLQAKVQALEREVAAAQAALKKLVSGEFVLIGSTQDREQLMARIKELEREVARLTGQRDGLARAGLMLPDKDVGFVLGNVTGCCHFNDNGACLDHRGGRHTSNYCDKAHEQASQKVADAGRPKAT